jgi:methylenetetrahydrofolate reductase (NADPH)
LKVPEHIRNATEPMVSYEVLPPTKGASIEPIFENLDPLMEFKPPYINITFHQPETIFIDKQNGLLQAKTVRKRPGTVAIAAAIKNRYSVDVVPHIICGGFTKDEIEDALIVLHYLGIDNILAVRGDGDPISRSFKPVREGHQYAGGLIDQIIRLNNGKYLDLELKNASSTNFCVGVAGYLEKHAESPNLETDLKRLKAKVDAGAEYVVTQMFFDNHKFFSFVKLCRDIGIEVPIIPGIKQISIKKYLSLLPQIFKVDIPYELAREVDMCQNNSEVRQLGIEWTTQQSKELFAAGVPIIHFFTMGNSDNVLAILERLF